MIYDEAPLVVADTGNARANKRKDIEAQRDRFLRRKSWFITEMMRQQANRYQMALDEDYYDGEQWTPSEAAIVKARGQNPVVFNECAPMVDFLQGTERRSRTDFSVVCRTDNSDQAYEEARAKAALLKFVDDINRTQFVRSDVADEQFKAGLGWLEIGVRADPTDYPIYKRRESWRNMLYDSLGASKLPEDWRYQFRFREVDFDIAEAMIPDGQRKKVDLLKKAIINENTRAYMDWFNGSPVHGATMMGLDQGLTGKWTTYDADAWLTNPRQRVMLIECWATEPFKDTTGKGAGFHDRVLMRKRCAVMTEFDTLFEEWSPYNHDQFPFIPLWCYRRKKDGAPYGVIRRHRSAQDSLNKFMSKAQWRSATRQILIEEGALDREVMDEDELEERAAAPNAILQFAKGALSGKKVEIREGAALAQADIAMAERFAMSIRANGPVSTEDRGQEAAQGAVSGKARAIRQEQGSRMVAEVFDNMLLARQLEGEMTLSLAEQYHTDPMTFGVSGEGQKGTYHSINQPGPNGTKLNDMQARKHTFVIGEAPWQQSMAEAAFETVMSMMGEVAKVAPNVVVAILDVLFEMHPSLPKRQTILKRIRSVTGMEDPDEGETPEQQAKREQQAKLSQAQFEAQLGMLRADVAEATARGEKLTAEAMRQRLESLYMAAQAAQVLTMAPAIAPVADELARSVGFQDQNGDSIIGQPVPTVAAPAVPDAQQTDGALAGGMAGAVSPAVSGVQQPQE